MSTDWQFFSTRIAGCTVAQMETGLRAYGSALV